MSNTEKTKDIFLVIKHTQRVSKGQHTEMKDWKKNGGVWDTYEEAIVTDDLKTRLKSEATYIINVSKMKIEKNRHANDMSEDDVKKLYVGYMTKYQENIGQFYVRFRPQILEEMIKARAAQMSIQNGEEAQALLAPAEQVEETTETSNS